MAVERVPDKEMSVAVAGVPRVSVIIPTRNRGPLLKRAVASVLSQTFGDFELIIVDNASSDDAAGRIAKTDHRIRYIRHELPKGPCAARNAGIRAARGPYLAFLDDDDEWLPAKLERQVQLLDAAPPDVGVVYTGIQSPRPDGMLHIARARQAGDVFESLFEIFNDDVHGLPVNNVTMMVKRECFDDVGMFDEELVYGEAWDMHVRLARRWRFAPIEEPLAVLHRHALGISRDRRLVAAGRRRLVHKFAAELRTRPRARSAFYLMLGVLERDLGNGSRARADFVRAIAAWPSNWKAVGHLTLTFAPPVVRDRVATLWHALRRHRGNRRDRRAAAQG